MMEIDQEARKISAWAFGRKLQKIMTEAEDKVDNSLREASSKSKIYRSGLQCVRTNLTMIAGVHCDFCGGTGHQRGLCSSEQRLWTALYCAPEKI